MANIGLNTIFPSARFLATDSKGDVQEVTSSTGSNASASLQGIDVAPVALEEAGNGITFAIQESNGVADTISAVDNTITLSLSDVATNYKLGESYVVTAIAPVDSVSSSANLQGIEIESVAVGTNGDGITFEITEQNSSDSISGSVNTITLALFKNASDYKLNQYSIDTDSGSAHTGIQIGEFIYFITDDTIAWKDVSTATNVSLSFTSGTSLEVVGKDGTGRPIVEVGGTQYAVMATNYKTTFGRRLDSIATIISSAGSDVTSLVSISISGADADNLTGTGSVVTSGGVNAQAGVDGVNNPSISSILDGAQSDVTDLVSFTITGQTTDFLTGAGSVVTQGGQDTINPTLNPDSKYLLVDIADIYDLESAEEADGRKVFYGLLETASANIANSSAKSENLVINRGNLILVSENQLRRSYSITATLDILDSDLSDES